MKWTEPKTSNHMYEFNSGSFPFHRREPPSPIRVSPLPETGEPLETDQTQKGPRSQSQSKETSLILETHLSFARIRGPFWCHQMHHVHDVGKRLVLDRDVVVVSQVIDPKPQGGNPDQALHCLCIEFVVVPTREKRGVFCELGRCRRVAVHVVAQMVARRLSGSLDRKRPRGSASPAHETRYRRARLARGRNGHVGADCPVFVRVDARQHRRSATLPHVLLTSRVSPMYGDGHLPGLTPRNAPMLNRFWVNLG